MNKQIATGLLDDTTRLIKEFVAADSIEFLTFAEIWRKNHFSLIFMGRCNDFQLTQFTHEAFRIASKFLSEKLFLYQVGGVYTLYAMYRNQISKPKIMIRIDLDQANAIWNLHQEAVEKKYKTLQFVIEFLIKENALQFVQSQKLWGPILSSAPAITETSEVIASMKSSLKDDMKEYAANTTLEELSAMSKEYAALKQKLKPCIRVNLATDSEIYDKLYTDLSALLKDSSAKKSSDNEQTAEKKSIGERRAEIKKAAFENEAVDFRRKKVDEDESESESEIEISDVDDPFGLSPIKLPESGCKRRRQFKRGRGQSKKPGKVGRPKAKDKAEEDEALSPKEGATSSKQRALPYRKRTTSSKQRVSSSEKRKTLSRQRDSSSEKEATSSKQGGSSSDIQAALSKQYMFGIDVTHFTKQREELFQLPPMPKPRSKTLPYYKKSANRQKKLQRKNIEEFLPSDDPDDL